MTILYRRFLLVAAFIAAMGAVTANVIQETKTARNSPLNSMQIKNPASGHSCADQQLCAVGAEKFILVAAIRG